eukprot:6990550-Pyramimonas_sp.AAC.1
MGANRGHRPVGPAGARALAAGGRRDGASSSRAWAPVNTRGPVATRGPPARWARRLSLIHISEPTRPEPI